MPFGPTNGPTTFINFIHDVNSQWNALAQKSGMVINDDTNTKNIVDNIFSWAKLLDVALLYIKCHLHVCQSYQLSLSVRKNHIFLKCFNFFGINFCLDENHPAMSKHQLLEHWPQSEIVQDVAKIVGFTQFYSKFIPQFELRITPLCNLTTNFKFTEPITLHWTTAAQESLKDINKLSSWIHAFSTSIING
jgi:hypothetical protein